MWVDLLSILFYNKYLSKLKKNIKHTTWSDSITITYISILIGSISQFHILGQWLVTSCVKATYLIKKERERERERERLAQFILKPCSPRTKEEEVSGPANKSSNCCHLKVKLPEGCYGKGSGFLRNNVNSHTHTSYLRCEYYHLVVKKKKEYITSKMRNVLYTNTGRLWCHLRQEVERHCSRSPGCAHTCFLCG